MLVQNVLADSIQYVKNVVDGFGSLLFDEDCRPEVVSASLLMAMAERAAMVSSPSSVRLGYWAPGSLTIPEQIFKMSAFQACDAHSNHVRTRSNSRHAPRSEMRGTPRKNSKPSSPVRDHFLNLKNIVALWDGSDILPAQTVWYVMSRLAEIRNGGLWRGMLGPEESGPFYCASPKAGHPARIPCAVFP